MHISTSSEFNHTKVKIKIGTHDIFQNVIFINTLKLTYKSPVHQVKAKEQIKKKGKNINSTLTIHTQLITHKTAAL
jgi:hypothetical protein